MSDRIGPELAAEVARRAQPHPYASHPAALVLADHQPECVMKATLPAAPVMCCCGVMVAWCDFSAHQTGVLQQAGLLAEPSATCSACGGPMRTCGDPAEGDGCGLDRCYRCKPAGTQPCDHK